MVGKIGTQYVKFCEQVPIIAQDRQRDTEAAHDAEIVFLWGILEKYLQHAKREYQSSQRQRDDEDQRKILLSAIPETAQCCQKPTDCAQIRHQYPTLSPM